ncbi:MAG TPA: RHS repeat-associated core domain-containing protein [Actinomycetota bacterium]|nr:RHS repeat-associated core domain-containing protein [Actinomycetota bacterium]
MKESEHHGATSKITRFNYLGTTPLVASEDQTGSTSATRAYSYDIYGHRLAMSDMRGGNTREYTFGYDVQGSVSTLLREDGGVDDATVEASYGYLPFGGEDRQLSQGDELTNAQGEVTNFDPTNSFRYTGKRFDTGSKTLDTGARRFAVGTGRFLQQDLYRGALANLSLSLDPLTSNRYSFAGGNPVSYIEWDGHQPVGADGSIAARHVYNGPSKRPSAGDDNDGDGHFSTNPGFYAPQGRFTTNDGDGVLTAERIRPPQEQPWGDDLAHGLRDGVTGYDVQDHGDYIAEVAKEAGVDPRTLWAIYKVESNFGAMSPLTRAWDLVLLIGDTLGVKETSIGPTQMQRRDFVDTLMRYPEVLGHRVSESEASDRWNQLSTDSGFAIRVTAYRLARLQDIVRESGDYSYFEQQRMIATGYGPKGGPLKPPNDDYLDDFDDAFADASQFYCGVEAPYACTGP